MSVQQNEFSPFKLLLKQVYSAHTSRVKELENEVKILKEKLIEKIRESNESVLDCKRCTELEEAFKSCKKALHEQSKWFETFGQKFSIFNGSEQENQDLKVAEKPPDCIAEAIQTTKILTDAGLCEKSETSAISLGENVTRTKCISTVSKESVPSSNSNLLKKVIYDGGSIGSFDMCTVTFPQILKCETPNVKSDCAILAPDSLDIDQNANTNRCESNHNSSGEIKSKILNSNKPDSCEGKLSHQKTKVPVKRLSSDSLNDDRIKRCSKNSNESDSEITLTKTTKTDDSNIKKNITNNTSNLTDVKSSVMKDLGVKNSKLTKKKDIIEVIVSSDHKITETPKSNLRLQNILINNGKNKSTSEISPSLLPKSENVQPKIINLEPASNDDDFIEHVSSNKPIQNEDSWDTCEKRKPLKKSRTIKSVKSTSKFKMTLDAPPLNYRKPTYKQIKLSKSFFQNKHKKPISNGSSPKKPSTSKKEDVKEIENDSFSTFLPDKFQTSTQFNAIKSPCAVDIDATFIPENYKFEVTPCGTTAVKKSTVEESHFKNGSLFSNISFPGELKLAKMSDDSDNIEDIKDSPFEEVEMKENVDSFDRLPVPEEPNYKYKNEVVRKKSERKQLDGFDCKECEKYYSELGLPDEEKKKRMKKCSRHRAKFEPPATPDHFWELDFPDTQECKARGYMNETQKVKLHNLCDI